MEEEFDLNAQFLCIILREQLLFPKKMLYLPPFSKLNELFYKSSQIITFIHSFMPAIKYNSRRI